MANKKSGKKKIDPVKLSFFVIIGLLVIFSAVSIIYNMRQSRLEIDNWEEVTSKHETGTYFVYIYADSCIYCQEIRGDVADFAEGNEGDIPLYYVDWPVVPRALIEADIITGTPTLLVFNEGDWVDTVVGPGPIVDTFESVNNGTFQP
ncbi:MAG: thioredoxin family protein [Candidatus Izemoplasmataceae bacterium]